MITLSSGKLCKTVKQHRCECIFDLRTGRFHLHRLHRLRRLRQGFKKGVREGGLVSGVGFVLVLCIYNRPQDARVLECVCVCLYYRDPGARTNNLGTAHYKANEVHDHRRLITPRFSVITRSKCKSKNEAT